MTEMNQRRASRDLRFALTRDDEPIRSIGLCEPGVISIQVEPSGDQPWRDSIASCGAGGFEPSHGHPHWPDLALEIGQRLLIEVCGPGESEAPHSVSERVDGARLAEMAEEDANPGAANPDTAEQRPLIECRFEVKVNGEALVRPGLDEPGHFGISIARRWSVRDRLPSWLRLIAGGYRDRDHTLLNWLPEGVYPLEVGDRITIDVLGPGPFDRPVREFHTRPRR